MKRNTWRQFAMWTLLALALAFSAACSNSGAVDSGGDFDIEDVERISTDVPCIDDSDCANSELCMTLDTGSFCMAVACADNTDCANAGTGCYCQSGTYCICPDTPTDGDTTDGDYVPDGDENVPGLRLCAQPSTVDFGAVMLDFRNEKDVNLCNCGEPKDGDPDLLVLNGVRINDDNPSACDNEFDLVGDIPTNTNTKKLASGDCHPITVTYAPCDPGADNATLTVGTNVGFFDIPLESEEKGEAEIQVTCTDVVDDQDPCTYSYGPVPVNDLEVMTCRIENVRQGDADNKVLRITDIELEEPLTPHFQIDDDSVDAVINGTNDQIWLSPGDSVPFTVIYHPRNRDIHTMNLLIYHDDIDVRDKTCEPVEPQNPYSIALIGAGVVPELSIDPFPSARFGNVPRGECKTQRISMTNIGGAPLTIDSVGLQDTSGLLGQVFGMDKDPDEDGVDNIPTDPPLATWDFREISVTCCPLGREAYVNTLEIVSNSLGVDNYYTQLPIACTGVTPYCEIYPLNLDFGSVRVGQDAILEVRINNNGQATARIENAYIDGSLNFEFADPIFFPLDIAPGGQLGINVRFNATDAGSFQATLNIIPQEGDCDQVSVNMTGLAVAPMLDGPHDCITWTDTQVVPNPEPDGWEHETQEITLKNGSFDPDDAQGSTVLTISEVFIPPEFGDTFELVHPSTPALVPAGGTWAMQATYKPSSVGDDQATIVVCSDAANVYGNQSSYQCTDPNMKAYNICLLGNAINPRLFVEPSSGKKVFRNALVGEQISDTIKIHNTGEGPLHIDSIEFGFGSPAIYLPDENGVVPEIPPGGMDLWPNDPPISVLIIFEPPGQGTHFRGLEIKHNDKDATKPDGALGSEYPYYLFEVYGSADENTPPVAVAKSPPNVPIGPYGTRQVYISVDDAIDIDGSASYDNDDDPETEEVEDSVVAWEWTMKLADGTAVPAGAAEFLAPTNGSITRAQFFQTGTYEVALRVKDTRNEWSDPSPIDSKLTIYVQQAPVAIAYECDTFQNFITTDTGTQLCFDGNASYDVDGTVDDYFWYIQKLGGPKTNFAIGTARARYTIPEAGTYYVTLVVQDNEGIMSTNTVENEIEIVAETNEAMRVRMTWTNGGNADLHYIAPGGYFGDFTDATKTNPSPNWQASMQCGFPQWTGGSNESSGGPESVSHPDPCDGSYRVTAEYITPSQTCGYVTKARRYEKDCKRCGCGCYICLGFNCCKSCTVTSEEWECEDNPTQVTFELYTGESSFPKFTITGQDYILDHAGDRCSGTLIRRDGEWFL